MTLSSGSGKGKHFLVSTSILRSHRMVNKSMQCAAKAAENGAMRLRFAVARETGSPEAADVSSSVASATQPAPVDAAGARGDALRDIGDYEL